MSEATKTARPPVGRSGPTKLTPDDIAGAIFEREGTHSHGGQTHLNMLESTEKAFSSGFYSSDAMDAPIDSYPYDEFCYFTAGSLTLTSADGSVENFAPGETAFIPKGWKGRWTTPGLSKFYAVYTAGGPN